MDRELYKKMRDVWNEKNMLVEDAKDSGEKELIDEAYHDLFIVEEVLSKIAGLTDIDFDHWGKEFWNDLKRWEEKINGKQEN